MNAVFRFVAWQSSQVTKSVTVIGPTWTFLTLFLVPWTITVILFMDWWEGHVGFWTAYGLSWMVGVVWGSGVWPLAMLTIHSYTKN